jgi:hypothetical protein
MVRDTHVSPFGQSYALLSDFVCIPLFRRKLNSQAFGAPQHYEKQFDKHKERATKIALKLVYRHLVHHKMMRNSLMNTKNGQLKIALKLVYKHLAHHNMMRNSFISTKNGQFKSP